MIVLWFLIIWISITLKPYLSPSLSIIDISIHSRPPFWERELHPKVLVIAPILILLLLLNLLLLRPDLLINLWFNLLHVVLLFFLFWLQLLLLRRLMLVGRFFVPGVVVVYFHGLVRRVRRVWRVVVIHVVLHHVVDVMRNVFVTFPQAVLCLFFLNFLNHRVDFQSFVLVPWEA